MTTFNTLLDSDDSGLVWLLDVSFDDFATVSYRWSTADTTVSGNDYDARIASITPITRSFGHDHLPAASTTKLRISNSDFAADWLTDRTIVASSLFKARFKLSAYLFNKRSYGTAADALDAAAQVIGIFTCLNQPEQMGAGVDITLADDSLGRLAEPLTTPTIRDWQEAGTFHTLNPFTGGPAPAMDWDVPLPLVFGLGEYNVQVPAFLAVANFELQNLDVFPIVVCASKAGTTPSLYPEIRRLQGTFRKDIGGGGGASAFAGRSIEIPSKFLSAEVGTNGQEITIWRSVRSFTITKSGRDWGIVYLEFNVGWYRRWFEQTWPDPQLTEKGANSTANREAPFSLAAQQSGINDLGRTMMAFESFKVAGSPLSVVSTTFNSETGLSQPSQRLVDHIFDAIAYYSNATTADMDTAAWTRAAKARNTVLGSGIIQPARPRPLEQQQNSGWPSPTPRDGIVGVLRTALGEMCGSADVDLFMTKDGLYSVSSNVFDFTAITATRTDVDESRIDRVRIRTPSAGERWAPYNRVMLTGPGGASYGPFDNQAAITLWGRVLPVTLQGKWNQRLWGESAAFGASSVWEYRKLESKVRNVVRFVADRAYLALELGEYFNFTYTRGALSTVFNGSIFRLEGMRIDPATLALELDAIWSDDLATDLPFLLDDEDFLIRVASGGGRTATVVDASTVVTFSSGDLVADGVAVGDILVLKDATQAANVFTRYRALLISSVLGAFQLEINDPDLAFSAGAGTAVATWTIYRGKTTYPTSATDPVNYPSGGTMYGKACSVADLYSDATAANKLLDG